MPFIQKINVPQPNKGNFGFTRFEGGLNNASSAIELANNESPELLNVIYNELGAFETRPGLFKYALSQIPEQIKQIFYYETATFKCFLLSSDINLYRLNVGEDNYSVVCALTNPISGFQKGDKFYFVDGTTYKEYDGTNIYTINTFSSYEISTARYATANTIEFPIEGFSQLENQYVGYKIEIVGGRGYGQINDITASVLDLANATAKIDYVETLAFWIPTTTLIPRMPDNYYNGFQVTITSGTGAGQQRKITQYVSSAHKFIIDSPWGILPDTTSYVQIQMYKCKITVDDDWDVIPDSTSIAYITKYPSGATKVDTSLKTKQYVPSYLEVSDVFKGAQITSTVVKCKKALLHKNRVWFADGTNKNIVYYTDLDNQYYTPTNCFIASLTNDGDTIVGLKSFNDTLVIFKKKSIFALFGTDHDDFVMKQLNVPCGAFNQDVIQQVGNYLLYLGTDGRVYSLYDVRTDVQKMMAKDISTQINIASKPIGIDPKLITTALATYVNNMYILAINDKILVYNELYNSWLLWDNIRPQSMITYENQILLTNSNRYLYRMAFKPFYITESYANALDRTLYLRKGYVNEIGVDFSIRVGDMTLAPNVLYNKLTNNTLSSLSNAADNQTVNFYYTSMLCYNDQENGQYKVVYHTKDSNFNIPHKNKKFRKIYLTSKTYKWFNGVITLKGYIDYYEVNTDVNIDNQISLFGVAKFGDRFIDRNIVQSNPITINQRGRTIRFIIDMTCNDNPICIYEINGEYEIL